MPVLLNARYECFAQEVAKGTNGTQAYIAAGFEATPRSAGVNASKLLATAKVADRVAELQAERARMSAEATAQATKRLSIDRQWVMAQLVETHNKASAAADYSASNRALELLGKELGMFVNRKEVGAPGDFTKMSDDELLRIIEQGYREGGFGSKPN